jgi:serine phosphatase RsbU (regulator of sigma subunit)/pSer/pThr/pTyr-binding forkhead associated (FHA) protein
MAVLRVLQGPTQGKIYSLERDTMVLGRHPNCDIVLEVGAVSREHARVVKVDENFFLEDLKSRNGTFLNNEQLEGRRKLNEKDQIRICDLVLVFNHGTPEVTVDNADNFDSDMAGVGAMLVDDAAEFNSKSTITSKIDFSSGRSGLSLAVNAETKLKAVLDILQAIGAAVELDEVLPKILDGLFTVFVQADRGFIVLKDKTTGNFIPRATKHRREDDEENIRISRTILNAVTEGKEAILSKDAAEDDRLAGGVSIVDFQIHSMMAVPLLSTEQDVLGVMQVDTHDLIHRFGEDDLELLAAVAMQAAVAIENAQLHEVAVREAAIKQDLALASKIQRGFLPDHGPDVDGYEFFSYYYPARTIGGDFFDYIPMPDGRIVIVLADVAGKGIAASLIVAKLASEFRICLLSEPTPEAAIARMNNIFCDPRWEDRFVTAVLMVLQPRAHEVCIVNAGHMAPLLRHADGTIEEIGQELSGLPIGVAEDMEFDPLTISMAIGDSLTAYTDGIPDAANIRDEFYGTDRLLTEMNAKPFKNVDEMGRHVIDHVRRFAGSQSQTDDMCVTIFGRTE